MSDDELLGIDENLSEITDEIDGNIDELVPDKPITKDYQPYPVSDIYKEASRNTICHQLRMAYRTIEDGDLEASKLSIRIAITMAKAMAAKLKQYNYRIGKEMFLKRPIEKRR